MLDAARRRVDETRAGKCRADPGRCAGAPFDPGYVRPADVAARGHVLRRSGRRFQQPDPRAAAGRVGWSWRYGRRSTRTRTGRSRSRSRCAISGRPRPNRRTRRDRTPLATANICAAFSTAPVLPRSRSSRGGLTFAAIRPAAMAEHAVQFGCVQRLIDEKQAGEAARQAIVRDIEAAFAPYATARGHAPAGDVPARQRAPAGIGGGCEALRRRSARSSGQFVGNIAIFIGEEAFRTGDMAKRRADQLLVDRGLAESRAKAQALIIAGLVTAAGRRIDKPGTAVAEDAELTVAGRDHPWVSRGGIKLDFALDHFAIRRRRDGARYRRLDRRVYRRAAGARRRAGARGRCRSRPARLEIAPGPRVVVHEGVNARYLTRQEIPEPIDLITCDASFIGLATVLPAPLSLAAERGRPGRADQAAIRGRTGRGRERRRRARPGGSPRGVRARVGLGRGAARLERHRHRRKPDARPRRQPRIPASCPPRVPRCE